MPVLTAALLGKELTHSVSPQLHRELFDILRKKFSFAETGIEYTAIEMPDESHVTAWAAAASTGGVRGANVTYPYKSFVSRLADRHVGVSAFIDSANSLRFTSNELVAASTDGAGLLNSILRSYPNFDLEHYHLILLGAGSAAKAAVYSLCTRWMPQSLTICSRSRAEAEVLAEFCIAKAPGPTVQVMSINDLISSPPSPHYRLVIQCTPVGQINHPGNLLTGFSWHETDFAIDLIYNPLHSALVRNASEAGAKTLNGLGMLIEQAALSQLFWLTGLIADSSPLSENEFEYLKNFLTTELTD